jgi:hypothetical protein
MRKTVVAVTGALVLTAWAVSAQERMKTTAESPLSRLRRGAGNDARVRQIPGVSDHNHSQCHAERQGCRRLGGRRAPRRPRQVSWVVR